MDALDFLRPCAEDGLPGGLSVPAAVSLLAGGADDVHDFPASVASS